MYNDIGNQAWAILVILFSLLTFLVNSFIGATGGLVIEVAILGLFGSILYLVSKRN